jgi:TPR repeat protein
LAQIKPDKQSSSLRRIYISPFRKLGIISGKQIALMGVPQTAENTPVADFFSKVVSKSEQNKIKIAEKQQALEDSCHPPKEKNKDGIELHAIGIYEGPLQRSNDPSNKVDIKVYASEHPIVLALLSYESATWNITLDKGATLKEIILKTSDGIRVSGANSKAVKVTRQNIGSTAYKDCDFFRMVAPRLKEFSGLNVTSFQGAYSGIGFPVRPQQQVGETAIKVQALTSKPITTVYVGLDEGLDAYSRGDYRAALEKLMPLAETGIAMAQNTVGKMYLSGQGVPKDYNKAMLLFQKAAKQQLANAQNNIGVIYAGGYGVPQDFNRAIVWFEMAANRGFVNAMLNLADIYEEGVVVRKNPIAAEMWRHRAQGLPSHEEKGTVTVELSGSEEYRKGLDLYHNFRFREAFCHFLPAAINGHPEAQLNLASIYRNGQGGEKDEHLAQRWAEKGKARIEELAQATNSGVRNLVGSKDFNEGLVLYRNGKERESFCFFLKAAELNHPDAQMKLALMYQDGVGGRKDERQAQYWYKKAANKGYSSNDGRDRVYMLDAESTEAPIPPAAPKACGCTAEVPIDRCCK